MPKEQQAGSKQMIKSKTDPPNCKSETETSARKQHKHLLDTVTS